MRSVSLILVSLFLAGCSLNRGAIEFCAIKNGRLDTESVRFNIEDRRIYGIDVSYKFEIIESEVAKGFVSPFPLALPKTLRGTSNVPEQWQLGEFVFTTTNLSTVDPDWILIHAAPTDVAHPSKSIRQTSVLYSLSEGVLAIRWPSSNAEEDLSVELFFCGTGHLHVSTF